MFRSDSKAFLSVTDLASVIFLSFHSAFAQPCKTVYNRSLDFFNEKVVHLLSSLYITYYRDVSLKKQNKEICIRLSLCILTVFVCPSFQYLNKMLAADT